MNKKSKRILSVFIGIAMLLLNVIPFIPTVHAEPENLTLQMDAASVSGNTFTYNVDGTNVTATVSGSNYTINGNNIELTSDHINDIKITLGNTFNSSNMEVQFHTGDKISVNGDNELVLIASEFPENAPHISIVSTNQGGGSGGNGDTSDPSGNGTSTLNYSINGAIEYTSGGGYDYGITFSINGRRYRADESKMNYTEAPAVERDEHGQIIYNDNNEPIPVKDENGNPIYEKTSLAINGDTIHYDYDTNTNKVSFVFGMAPGTLMTGLVINGQNITNLPKTANELLACYIDHHLEIVVDDIDKADTYTIEITARYPNSSEEFMGNFLWDYNPDGYTGPDDKILNATLEFVKATYDGHTYTTEDEINQLGGVYIWKDAERKKTYIDDREGCGEGQFPKGTELTVRIIPDAGYQLVDFGINGGVFEPQEEIGTYTFTVEGGPFHLQATIKQVEDVVKTTSEKVSAGSIELGEESSMVVGTARLDVKDIKLTKEQISNFEENSNGYEIKNYLDISLYNTVFKGEESKSWDTEVKELDNEATIYLQLEDDVNGEEIVIVHEKHDGTYEIIPTEYIKEYNAIMFKTRSFSNYAIASKLTAKNPKTGDNIMLYVSMFGISVLGLFLIKSKRYQ